jgi:3-dehydroquinate synthase
MKVDIRDIAGDLPDAEGLIELMSQDKKVLDGKMRFILARGIGQSFVTSDVDRAVLKTLLDEALAGRS